MMTGSHDPKLLGVSYITANLYYICGSACYVLLKQMQYILAVIFGPPSGTANIIKNVQGYML